MSFALSISSIFQLAVNRFNIKDLGECISLRAEWVCEIQSWEKEKIKEASKDVVWHKEEGGFGPKHHMLGSLQTIQDPETAAFCLSMTHS